MLISAAEGGLTNPSDTRLLQKLETHFLQSQKFMALRQQKNRLQNTSLSPQFSNTVFNTVFYEAELNDDEKLCVRCAFENGRKSINRSSLKH